MNLFSISTLATLISSFFLAFFVIYRGRTKLSRNWFWVSFFTGVWSLGLWGVVSSDKYQLALIYQYILDIGGIMIPLAFLNFVLILVKLKEKRKKIFYISFFFTILLLVLSFTPYFKNGLLINQGVFHYWINPGPLYFIFPAWFSFLMFYSFYLLAVRIKEFSGLARVQIKYIIIAGCIGFAGGATNFFPQIFGLYPIGNYFVVVYVFVVTYAILRYRLMGIRVVLSNIFIYAILVILTGIVFYFSLILNTALFKSLWSLQALFFNVFVGVVFVFLFIRILRFSRTASDVIFYHGKNPQHLLEELVFEFNQIVDINKLSKLLEKKIDQILEAKKVSIVFYLHDGNNPVKIFNKSNFSKMTAKEMAEIKDYLEKNKKIIVREELEGSKKLNQKNHAKMINLLNKHKISVVVPLEYHRDIIGYILLGDKENFEFFASEEISFLDAFSKQIASSFMDAYLYSNMKKEVARQTKELKGKNEHLEKLLQMRSEFLDIVSHQLRTPVSVIKGMLSMVIEGSVPPKKRQEFIEGSFKKSIKLGQIINDILRASEIDTDEEFKLKLAKTDIKPMLEDIYEDKKLELEDKNLEFKLDISKKLPMILTEESYLRQVVENLINNSIQYTKKGYIKLSAKEEKGFVVIRVADTGIGIPGADKDKLFKKFSRADNAVNVYTDGSGLGLFITKKIMDAHHDAEIYVEKSELNKGTTFAIKIPVVK